MDYSDWLDGEGLFYTYVGYGQFITLPQNDSRVCIRKRLLAEMPKMREGERKRLLMMLEIRKHQQREQHICAIMDDIVNLIKGQPIS